MPAVLRKQSAFFSNRPAGFAIMLVIVFLKRVSAYESSLPFSYILS